MRPEVLANDAPPSPTLLAIELGSRVSPLSILVALRLGSMVVSQQMPNPLWVSGRAGDARGPAELEKEHVTPKAATVGPFQIPERERDESGGRTHAAGKQPAFSLAVNQRAAWGSGSCCWYPDAMEPGSRAPQLLGQVASTFPGLPAPLSSGDPPRKPRGWTLPESMSGPEQLG